jgi:hypothetical protein
VLKEVGEVLGQLMEGKADEAIFDDVGAAPAPTLEDFEGVM